MKEDRTFIDTMERSYMAWLDEIEKSDDIAVRDGVRLAKEYVSHLKEENRRLRESNALKDSFLRRMKKRIGVLN